MEKRLKEGADIRFDIRQRISVATKTAISIAKPFSQEVALAENNFTRITESKSANEKVFASIQYVRLPAISDFFVRVFINLPEANASTPTESPNYAGSFAFFGTQQANPDPNVHDGTHQHAPKFLVNITDTLQKLRANGSLQGGGKISVQLVAVPFSDKFEREDTELHLDTIELIVTPVIINARQ